MAFVNERKEDGKWQTIDRDRNIVLEYLGGGRPQEPMDFKLTIDGVDLRFSALQRTKSLSNKKIHVEWDVQNIYAPSPLSEDKQKIHRIVEEALLGFGFAASTENVESLNITIAPHL